MMSRYARMFEALAVKREGALVPFLVLGDPDEATTLARIDAVVAAGADALELGLPFSDPVADGPTLVAAANRALASGMTTTRCLSLLREVRKRHSDVPIGLLVYANLVIARGINAFVADAAASGADSVLVADMPLHEAAPLREACTRHGIDPVFIVPPETDNDRLERIAQATRGYAYVLGRRGVTGAEQAAEAPLPERIAALKAAGAPPALIGFGISRAEHVHAAMASGAAGVIVGSALVDAFARGEDGAARIRELKLATRRRPV